MSRWLGLLVCLMLSQSVWAAEVTPSIIIEPTPVRALHFVLRGVPLDKACWMVDEAKQAGFNTILVLVTDGVALQHAPWRAKKGAWSRDEFKAWVSHAQGKGMQVIPELKLLTHQEKFLQGASSEFFFNSLTYNPENRVIYAKHVFPLIDEIVALISPKAIHIGHDEVAGFARWWWPKWLKYDEQMLPAELFYMDTIRLHDYLAKRGIETWMWGDMMISPEEFPDMKPNPLHGREAGYGKALRGRLPKDIVVCDWHYADDQEEFPSLGVLRAEGFRVLGATWKKEKTIRNFSYYAASQGAGGMIATTWFDVQQKNWKTVEKIISNSGKIFSRDFPDAR